VSKKCAQIAFFAAGSPKSGQKWAKNQLFQVESLFLLGVLGVELIPKMERAIFQLFRSISES
jgi:hypothetical protein